ncbi:MAG: adenine phosphoribosyltransferase [Deltaproteobacteria bacterium]
MSDIDIKRLVRTVPDFPKPGVSYKDITPILSDPEALAAVVDSLAQRYRGRVDAIVGIESRGFIVGAPLAYALGVGLAVVRKQGKLPYHTRAVSYQLEYGSDTLEIHTDALGSGVRAVVVDDLLATGGTASAAAQLVTELGAEVVECAFIIELAFLGGRRRLEPVPCHSLVVYNDE